MKAEIKNMPEFHVAYVRKLGPYGPETCGAAFGELTAWAGPRGHYQSGVVLGLYWDDPSKTAPDQCRTDACISVPVGTETEGSVQLQVVPGGTYAVCRFESTAEGFQQAWKEAYAWLFAEGHQCAEGPSYEFYHNNGQEHPEHIWIFDICIPVK